MYECTEHMTNRLVFGFPSNMQELVSLPCHHVLCKKAVNTGGSTTAAQNAARQQTGGHSMHSQRPYTYPTDAVTASPIRVGRLYSIWQGESFLWELQPQVARVSVKSSMRVSGTFFPFAPF